MSEVETKKKIIDLNLPENESIEEADKDIDSLIESIMKESSK